MAPFVLLLVVVGPVIALAHWTVRRLRRSLLAESRFAEAGDASLRGQLRPYRFAVGWSILLDCVAVAAGLAAPWPVKAVIDSITGGRVGPPFDVAGAHRVVVVAVGAGILLVLTLAVLDYLSVVLAESIGATLGVRLRQAVISKFMRLPAAFAGEQRNGDVVTRLTTDVARVQEATLDRWRVIVPNAVALCGMVALMALLNPLLALATATLAPIMGVAFWFRRRRVAEAQRLARVRSGDLATRISEMARTVSAAQAFGRQDHERVRLEVAGRAAATTSIRAVMASGRLAPLADLVIAFNLAVVLAVGAAQVRAHHFSVGGLVVFLTYLGALQLPVRALSRLSRTLGSGLASRERLERILSARELPRAANPVALSPIAPVLAAHGVSYTYGDGRQALRDVTACIPAGEITVIEGANGAGKSTLLSLLVRLDDPTGGVITLNGVDLKDYDLDQLRRQIAFVPQEPWLGDGTLLENIAYGCPDASRAQVMAAARVALVDEFADRLPAGWATALGEAGAALSGGQKRRVALARAVLRDASLLVLDEPTTGLDARAQELVRAAIRAVAVGKTTVLVTHDRELASLADYRVTLAGGSVAELPAPLAAAERP